MTGRGTKIPPPRQLVACMDTCGQLADYSAQGIESSPPALKKQADAKTTAEKMFRKFCKSLGPHFSVILKFCHLRFQPYLSTREGLYLDGERNWVRSHKVATWKLKREAPAAHHQCLTMAGWSHRPDKWRYIVVISIIHLS